MVCPVCGLPFAPTGRRQYCSDACRVAAHRRRHQTAPPPTAIPPAGHRQAVTIYQCPDCDERTVGDQFCRDCGTFMRRVNWGGECPHCYEPVTVDELLNP